MRRNSWSVRLASNGWDENDRILEFYDRPLNTTYFSGVLPCVTGYKNEWLVISHLLDGRNDCTNVSFKCKSPAKCLT